MLECLGLFSGSPRLCLRLVLVLGLMFSGFVVCFGDWGCFWPDMEVVKWTEPRLVQGVLRLDDALLNRGPKSRIFCVLLLCS